jgi:hypothetical protein
VSIVPMLIGVPVAATPGLEPHADVLLLVAAVVLVVVLGAGAGAGVVVLVDLLLLPHPARIIAPTAAASAKLKRTRGASLYLLTDLSSSV